MVETLATLPESSVPGESGIRMRRPRADGSGEEEFVPLRIGQLCGVREVTEARSPQADQPPNFLTAYAIRPQHPPQGDSVRSWRGLAARPT